MGVDEMMRKRRLTIVGAVVLVVLGIALSLGLGHRANPDGKEPERGDGHTLVRLDNVDKLYALLTPPQYIAVRQSLSDYIAQKSPDITSAYIQATTLQQDGTIQFQVVPNAGGLFVVVIRPSAEQLTFSVPQHHYEVTMSAEQINRLYEGAN
jgi:hypothetical protein